MEALGRSLRQLGEALWDFVLALFEVLGPWMPLILGLGAWIVFWTCAVNWVSFRETLVRGGWIGLVLVMFAAVIVWGAVDPPRHYRVRTAGETIDGTLVGYSEGALEIAVAPGETVTVPEDQVQDLDAYHRLLGLRVSNFTGKAVYVTALVCIMLLCGSVQLGGCCRVVEDEPVELHAAQHHAAPHQAAPHHAAH